MKKLIARGLCAVAAGAALTSSGVATATGAAAASGCGPRPAHRVTAYVVNSQSNTVTPIQVATNTAGKAIKVGVSPFAIAITPNGKTAYVDNYYSLT